MKLYRHPEVSAKPGVQAAIAASEAAADRLCELIGTDYAVCALPEEGIGGWRSCDLSPLVGRPVLLFAEHTPDSIADMRALARHLIASLECQLKGIVIPADQLPDWTPADWQEDEKAFRLWAGKHLEAELPAPEVPDVAPQSPEIDPEHPAWAEPPEDAALLKERPKPRKPRLAVVDGNTVREVEVELPAPVPLSEDAFAREFADEHGEDWRCVRAWGKWLHWDGASWLEDRTDKRVEPMRELYRAAQQSPQAAGMTPGTLRSTFGRRVPMYNSLILAGSDPRIRSEPEAWNADPWALGVPGGVIDLRTGAMHASAREQHVTMCCSVAPQRGTPKLWLDSLKQWMGGDEDLIGFLRRYLGYGLTGDAREQCMAFFYGQAASGKGTIMRAISGVMGSRQDGSDALRSYHYEAPISTFLESRNERHSTELASFYRKRLITSEEPAAGARWDEGKIKWITGGSMITARFISRDNFSFAMTGKIIVAANHRPRLATTDAAIKRRMHVVPFGFPVPADQRDNNLDAKLREEWPMILHWLIEGCQEWQDAGLGLPDRIAASTEEYLESEDTLGAWLDECCEREGDSESAGLYANYARWCERQGDKAWSRRAWANALVERGFRTRKGSGGVRMFCALRAKATAPDDGPPSWHNSD